MKRLILLSTLAFGMNSISSAAAAAPVAEEALITEEVRYSDLDPSDTKDRAKLKRRIARAAAHVCEEIDWTTPSRLVTVNRVCYRAALKNAVVQMDRVVTAANGNATLVVVASR